MGGRRRRSRKSRKLSVEKLKERHADHPYLDNIITRAVYDPEYREIKIKYQNRIVCFYCGMPATGVDHQPPLSRIDEYKKICVQKGKDMRLIKVSCCGECNRLLSNSVFSSFKAKLDNLRMRLKKKYRHIVPANKLEFGRLKRRLNFDRGLKRIQRYEDS